jgi:hypothetical protein
MNLLETYLDACRATRIADRATDEEDRGPLDAAVAREPEAEHALARWVKMAVGVDPSAPLRRPVAAALDGWLVVVAPHPDNDLSVQRDVVLVLDPRRIARAG